MRAEEEVFTVPGRAARRIELSGGDGTILAITTAGRMRPAYAVGSTRELGSKQGKAGQEIPFTTHSPKCAQQTRDALIDELRRNPS
jgi:hypothetical protein